MTNLDRELTQAAVAIGLSERAIESADRVLRPGILRPRRDTEVAAIVGIARWQLDQVVELIKTGEINLGLGNCGHCQGYGRFGDDVWCGACNGTGSIGE